MRSAGPSAYPGTRRRDDFTSDGYLAAGPAVPDAGAASSLAEPAGTSVQRHSRCNHSIADGACVNLHEYQAKEILRRHGVPIPDGDIATTPDAAEALAIKYGVQIGRAHV